MNTAAHHRHKQTNWDVQQSQLLPQQRIRHAQTGEAKTTKRTTPTQGKEGPTQCVLKQNPKYCSSSSNSCTNKAFQSSALQEDRAVGANTKKKRRRKRKEEDTERTTKKSYPLENGLGFLHLRA